MLPRNRRNLEPEAIRQGATLRALREANGWRVGKFAAALGYETHSYLSNVEAGRQRMTPEFAAKAAKLLGVPLAALLRPDEYGEVA